MRLLFIIVFLVYVHTCYGQTENQVFDSISRQLQNEHNYSSVDSKTWEEIAQESLNSVREKERLSQERQMAGGLVFNSVKSDDDSGNMSSALNWIALFILSCLFIGISISIYTSLLPSTNSQSMMAKRWGNPIKFQYVFLGSIFLGILTLAMCMVLFRPFRYDSWNDSAIPSSFFGYLDNKVSWVRGNEEGSIVERKDYLIKKSVVIGSIIMLGSLMIFSLKILLAPIYSFQDRK